MPPPPKKNLPRTVHQLLLTRKFCKVEQNFVNLQIFLCCQPLIQSQLCVLFKLKKAWLLKTNCHKTDNEIITDKLQK